MSDIPAVWPKSGPSHNQWNTDAAAFVKLLQEHSDLWHRDVTLKYLELRIDTRDGAFVLRDRDRRIINIEQILLAIAKETET